MRHKGGMPWLHEHFFSAAVPAPAAPGDCRNHLPRTLGVLMQWSAQLHGMPVTEEGGERKHIFIQILALTHPTARPVVLAQQEGGREGAEHTRPLPTSYCLTEEEVWRQGEMSMTCLASTTAKRNVCPKVINRCSPPKPSWASEKSYHLHFLSASPLPGINAPNICWYSCLYVCSPTLCRLNEPGYQTYYRNYLH